VTTLVPGGGCRVAWCLNAPCNGDHFASVGGLFWPGVTATAYTNDRAPQISVAPTWGECDGLEPAVLLYVEGGTLSQEWGVDLRPEEALRLAQELLRAVEALDQVRA
jgi:hypothetical protein